ncbi:MAG: hypothetical protein C5B51_05500 [Terriglobia bacterium]|nr:MAG: hypothetical protein C5B51_05500 [Terriglobia bacterium]
MADLRRWITALAILALFTGLASAQVGGGGGQTLQCALQAQPTPTLRAEGITEEVGDIVIICTGGSPVAGGLVPQTNVTVSLTSQVTSRLLGNGFNWSEAILLLDEPGSGLVPLIPATGPAAPLRVCPTAQTGCVAYTQIVAVGTSPVAVATSGPSVGAVNPATGPVAASDLAFNGYQGVVSGNQVTFFGVPILAPGTSAARVLRITNVRVNANGIGGGSASGSIPVQASLLSGNPFALPLSQATPIVGFVQAGLTTSSASAGAFGQCNTQPSPSLAPAFTTSNTAVQAAILGFSEGFGSSFKTRVDPTVPGQTSGQSGVLVQNKPGGVYNGESAFTVNPALLGIAAGFTAATTPPGLADAGTRLKAVFNNIPAGVHLFVSLYNIVRDAGTLTAVAGSANGGVQPASTSTTAFAQLVTGETVSDVSGFPGQTASTTVVNIVNALGQVIALPVVEITPTSGSSATAVWEVLNTNPDQLETFRFGAFVSYTASPGTNSPAAGTGTVNLSFAPTSTVTSASSGPIPRFIDTSTAKTAIQINICRTVLLFPFLTNQLGFDTGLAISNTSTDPFGTTPQAGTCDLNWYGANSVPKFTTASIATATTYADLVSIRAPNFQGYMIAVCNFQFAHGFAFVSDVGARNLAMGYLSLTIPDPGLSGGRSASNTDFAAGNSGEGLSH